MIKTGPNGLPTIPDGSSRVVWRCLYVLASDVPEVITDGVAWQSLYEMCLSCPEDDREPARLDVLREWMWTAVLPRLAAVAGEYGIADAWQRMIALRSREDAIGILAGMDEDGEDEVIEWFVETLDALIDASDDEHALYEAAEDVACVAAHAGSALGRDDAYWDAVKPVELLRRLAEAGART